MSDPSDPYRNIDIGGGVNPFGETISELGGVAEGFADVTESLTTTESALMNISDLIGAIADKMGVFAESTKEVQKSKFQKATKSLNKMFKNLAGASPKAFLIEALFNTLKPLLELFKPFQIILDMISALLKVMVGEALKPMFQALQPLFEAFISFMPMFQELGAAIGRILVAVLKPLMDIFIMLMPIIMPILTAIVELIEIALVPLMGLFENILPIIIEIVKIALIPLEIILSILAPIFKALAPIFELLSAALVPLAPVITLIADLIRNVLWTAFKVVVMAIAWFIDVISVGFAGAVNAATKFLAGIEADMMGAGGTTSSRTTGAITGERAGGRTRLASGGIALSETVATIGEAGPEAVVPLNKWERSISTQTALLSSMNDELVNISFVNRETLRERKTKNIFERMGTNRGRR
jgi:phage-related protein